MKVEHERIYLPGDKRVDLIKRHKRRYELFIKELKNSDTVLDFGCGSGYGTKMIARKVKIAIGYDTDFDAIAFAGQNNSLHNTIFTLSNDDVTLNQFNAICMIDVLEHLNDPKGTLGIVTGSVLYDGMLYITTPERGEKIDNQFHKQEYKIDELEQLLADLPLKTKIFYGSEKGISKIDDKQENLIVYARKV